MSRSNPDWPKQDRRAGLATTKLGDRQVTRYDPGVALSIIERVANGELLREICAKGEAGMPAASTFLKWVARVPELKEAYLAARTLSAAAMEEEALAYARELRKHPGNTEKIRATSEVISQLRWSASKRDPQNYSERSSGPVVVPVHIQTSLDLGAGVSQSVEMPDIYTLSVSPPVKKDADVIPSLEEARSLIEGLDEGKLGSERTALGHRKHDGGKHNRPKMTKEQAEKLAAEGKVSPFMRLLEDNTESKEGKDG